MNLFFECEIQLIKAQNALLSAGLLGSWGANYVDGSTPEEREAYSEIETE